MLFNTLWPPTNTTGSCSHTLTVLSITFLLGIARQPFLSLPDPYWVLFFGGALLLCSILEGLLGEADKWKAAELSTGAGCPLAGRRGGEVREKDGFIIRAWRGSWGKQAPVKWGGVSRQGRGHFWGKTFLRGEWGWSITKLEHLWR